MPWKFVCDLRFHEVLQITIIRQITKGNEKSKNTFKNRWDCVEIFTSACECVCVFVYVCFCVGYSCVLLCVNV